MIGSSAVMQVRYGTVGPPIPSPCEKGPILALLLLLLLSLSLYYCYTSTVVMRVSVCVRRSFTPSLYYVSISLSLFLHCSSLFSCLPPYLSSSFQVRWVFSYPARFAQLRKSLHSSIVLLLLQAILSRGRSVKHMQKLSAVRLRSLLAFCSPPLRGHPISSLTLVVNHIRVRN